MQNFENSISPPGGLYTDKPASVLRYGIIGQSANQPLDFEQAGGQIIATRFPCVQTATVFAQNVRLFSTSGANQMHMAMYTLTGPDSGNALVRTVTPVAFDNTVQIVTGSLSKNIVTGSDYWLAFQGLGSWRFFYNNSTGDFRFANLGNFVFGSFPATFTGVSIFEVICQYWSNYVY